jgi:hypothetical protein
MKRPAIIAATLLLSGGVAVANIRNGNELLESCTASQKLDAIAVLNGHHETCPPRGVTTGQILEVVVNYLRHHPETRHGPPSPLVMMAIREAWCTADK